MGANAKLFLEIRDIEENGGEFYAPPPKPKPLFLGTYYKTKDGKIIKEVGSKGRKRYCVYPGLDKSYVFWKGDLELIYKGEEKKQAAKLFKNGM